MALLHNPILPGFHPDPCLCRVGDWYYLANSTFEWWPGVRLHRSCDLANWELVGHALTRTTQLDLRGNPDSGGVWAPCLSWADGLFWLVYTDAKSFNGPFKDLRNYLVTAPAIGGPWSEPVPLNSGGFDPSLFHDADGRKWLVCMRWRVSTGLDAFDGIVLQEYSVAERRLVGTPERIFGGSPLGITEGPHLYRKDGAYWLVTAEGGTGWNHAVTVARAECLHGPYEIMPGNPLLTSRDRPELPLQKAGHASFVETPEGDWYMAYLCSRPVGDPRRCILGRETALQRLDWPSGAWPRLAGGGNAPSSFIEMPDCPVAAPYADRFRDDFDSSTLSHQWSTLRQPLEAPWLSLVERPGHLRLRGRYSLQSAFDQTTLGFRLLHPCCQVSTSLEFNPVSDQQQAGLALFYNSSNFYYLHVTSDGRGGRELRFLACDNRRHRELLVPPLPLPDTGPVILASRLEGDVLRFFLTCTGSEQQVGPVLDATILSDDYPSEAGISWAFTGAFAVLCSQDASDASVPADFDWFDYQALPTPPQPLSPHE